MMAKGSSDKRPAARLVVLVSGYGSNLQAILDACASGELPAQVVAVISNKSEAYGLERARQFGAAAVAYPKSREQDRSQYDAGLADLVASYQPDWIVLAGWLRILSPAFLERFPGRVVNLHPALPGAFPGRHSIERAYEAFSAGKIEHTGVMVHLVLDEGVDTGPVLAQETVPIYPGDTLAELEARMHLVEHHVLVTTLKRLAAETKYMMAPYDGCLFCKIAAGSVPSSPVYEDETTLAFMNIRQPNPGYVLVIPKAHIETIYDLDDIQAGHLLSTVAHVARAIRRSFNPPGLTLFQANGPASYQEVAHLHIHLFPRRLADGYVRYYPELPPEVDRLELDRLAKMIRQEMI